MRRLAWMVWTALVLQAFVATVMAGPLPAPKIVPGRYVYTIPAGFDPPLIGRRGLEEIQKSAEKLHYPYYVVIVEALPDGLVDSAGSEDEAAAQAIDGLAEDWQNASSDFDVGKSSIFMLSYNPRKYRFLAGATWKAKLGFEREAHQPYTDIFDQSVQGTPKDPKTGIIEMMKAVDEYLFDQTDPARIKARQEAAARAEQLRRLQEAQGRLDGEILRLEGLLRSPRAYLPGDTHTYVVALDKARRVRLADDPAAMLSEADSLQESNDVLARYVEERRSEAALRQFNQGLKVTATTLVFGLVLFLMLMRLRGYRRLRKAFETSLQEWDARLLNAKGKYADFYGNERGSVIGLSDMAGETKKLYDKVTNEVDAIYLGVESMEAHLDACRATARGASFFRVAPLRKAISDLNAEFEFDTGQLDPSNLFGPPTKVIRVKPPEFSQELESRFATTIEEWTELKEAAAIRNQPAEELFTESKLDEMEQIADAHGILHTWISDHPLFGSEAEDAALYDGVNVNRRNDPVAFMRRIGELRDRERQVCDRLNLLVKSVELVKAGRLESPPRFGATVLAPQDDPRLIFESARREEDKLAGLLAGRRGDDGAAEVEAQAQLVQKLYQSSAEQAAAVQSAIDDAGRTIEQSAAAVQAATELAARAASRLDEARVVHSNVGPPMATLGSGGEYLEAGQQTLDGARRKLDESRHLEARREAWQASEQITQATRDFNDCIRQCDELDRQKALYETRLAEMQDARRKAEERIRGYGLSGRLPDVPRQNTSGPADYLIYLAILDRLEQDWNTEVRNAQRVYEREQERIRVEQEAERRRSSSSGSGWGGGGSSSSGGSWGGGGGSSSSSSGGSW